MQGIRPPRQKYEICLGRLRPGQGSGCRIEVGIIWRMKQNERAGEHQIRNFLSNLFGGQMLKSKAHADVMSGLPLCRSIFGSTMTDDG